MDNKLVSVIIPTYSRPDFITRAIDSALSQIGCDMEVIVVDDNGKGSQYQQETEKLLEPYILHNKITYIAHDVNKNGSAARNTGFRASHGQYVTFLDDDDVMLPTKVSKQIAAIENADEKVAAAYCRCQIIRNGKILKTTKAIKYGNLMKDKLQGRWGFGSGSNLLLKREAVERIDGYDESFKRRQDIEFVIKFFRYYEIAAVDEVLLIKYNDSPVRRPDPRKYIEIEEHFLDTFKDDISSFGEAEAKKIYYSSYYKMALSAANTRDVSFMLKMLNIAKKYSCPSFKDLLRLVYNYIKRPHKR